MLGQWEELLLLFSQLFILSPRCFLERGSQVWKARGLTALRMKANPAVAGSLPPSRPLEPQPHPGHAHPVLLVACCSLQLILASSTAGLKLLGLGRGEGEGRSQLFIPTPSHGLELTLRVTVKGWPGDAGVRERGAGSCLMKSAQASWSRVRLCDPKGATPSPHSPPKLLSTGPVLSGL